ncbi:uncharacterized protein HMPREF1541_02549 [Cyphellophora europaea CBS 101466]|uniref:Uncharacterized protein n=1 Tax=Cyphellophora europaea (strain CBS 101466) TaxID=1220924 RepID=W2S488_CYPE1|nr:uncharacterized protein HMPREF1541_02549 [Cyphellophora europaea CBS 101466]ETN43390.1 hypothetical protein HMPREF1541_02549 [Cyphellophora europaea CBS 101466]
MSALSPDEPAQPTQQTGLNQAGNPASKTANEDAAARTTDSSATTEQRTTNDVPSTHDGDARPSALGSGDTGPLKERDISKSDQHPYSKNSELDGEQMRAPGEGEVAEAVKGGGGGGHKGQGDLMDDMDRKKQEHDAELKRRGERTGKEIEEEESEDWTNRNADVGEALAGRGTKIVLAPEGTS